MRVFLKVFFLLFFFFTYNFLIANDFYERIEYVKKLEKERNSLKIKIYYKMKDPNERLFLDSYWKVYYKKDKIVAEELYVKNKLSYYYIYYYEKDKIYQKGFFWHGVYYDIKYFKAHDKHIKQGLFYKNYPDVYNVYDKDGNLTYSYHYQDFES